CLLSFYSSLPRSLISTLFPYTTLFRSEEIIRNQSHPDNLVSIRASQTPVLAKPLAGAQVLFLADAEDEFQLVDTTGSWVHVQVSDRKSTRLNSSHQIISYAVFCLKKKT